ncbi:unnamed protein product [Moneuplotes crassus]|uniref:Uncharacterized protein n=1 Tax=Euplotes crassus TaxID=5936 RepID=A0AAD1UIP4_EUPCR|nr:unnamed protein product [Moneuplotes crassus]
MSGKKTENGKIRSKESILGGVWVVFISSLPIALAALGNAFKPTITIMAVNQDKKDEASLAAIGLGTTILNCVIRTLILGYNHSTTTLISQAYGAKDYGEVKRLLSKIRTVYSLGLIPFFVIVFFAGSFLKIIGQPVKLSEDTEFFIRLACLSFIGQLHYDINRRYLNAVGMRKIQMPIPYITLVLHGVWCFIFLNKLEWKAEGAAAVQFLQFFGNFGISEYIISKYASDSGDGKEDKHTSPDLTISEGIDMIMHGIPSALYEIISRISNEAPTFVAGFIAVELVMEFK